MAYVNHDPDPRRRAAAIAGVAVVHTALALVLLSMGVVGEREIVPPWKPFVVTPDPAPAPIPSPSPDDPSPARLNRPIVAPFPPLDPPIELPDRAIVDGPILGDAPRIDDIPFDRPTPTPRPSPGLTPKGAVPANRPASWISTDDYPARPLRDEIEGVAGYRVIVGSGGRVSSCEIIRSTGNLALDEATCRLISRRARFEAATDESGARVVGSYSGTVRWEIPD